MTTFRDNAIFWIEVEKINPNPFQPRKHFDERRMQELSESIRQYGVLQPLVVTRKEVLQPDGGMSVEYELIAGERRHRAARMVGLRAVPALIRSGEETEQMKLELAIIENLQREDLNAIDRARAFHQLAEDFNFTQNEIAKKIGRSREYVANSIRLLKLPLHMQEAIEDGRIMEGHGRPLLMLGDRPEEQETMFKEILVKKMTVRATERSARRIATDKIRKKERKPDPKVSAMEERLSESLGTRVRIESRDVGGKLVIDFFSPEDLEGIIALVSSNKKHTSSHLIDRYLNSVKEQTSNDKNLENKDIEQQTSSNSGHAGDQPVLQNNQQEEHKEHSSAQEESVYDVPSYGSSVVEETSVHMMSQESDDQGYSSKEENEEGEMSQKTDEQSPSSEQDETEDLYSISKFSI